MILLIFMTISIILALDASDDCQPVISEINSDYPDNKATNFFELELLCDTSTTTSKKVQAPGYKLVLLSSKNNKVEVELYANMVELAQKGSRFYTVGTDQVAPKVNLSFENDRVFYRRKHLPKNQMTLFAALPRESSSIFGLVLLQMTGNDASVLDSKLRQINNRQVHVDGSIVSLMKKGIRDLVVYGYKSTKTRCNLFQDLYAGFKDENFRLLRDINVANSQDSSIQRCSDTKNPYEFKSFKTGKLTPGAPNDCSGSFIILEQVLLKTVPTRPGAIPISESEEYSISEEGLPDGNFCEARSEQSPYHMVCEAESSSNMVETADNDLIESINSMGYRQQENWASPSQYSDILFEARASAGSSAMQRQNLDRTVTEIRIDIDDDAAESDSDIDESRPKKKKKIGTGIDDWTSTKYFKPQWTDFLRKRMQKNFDVSWLEKNADWKKWLIVTPNEVTPQDTIFQCRICLEHYDRIGMKPQEKPDLAKSSGVKLGQNKMKNREKFLYHVQGRSDYDRCRKNKDERVNVGKKGDCKRTQHNQIVERLIEESKKSLEKQIERATLPEKTDKEDKKLAATMNMFRTVYLEAILNIPHFQHEKIVKFLKATGVNIGSHHYEKRSASRMLQLMSEIFHRKLIKHLSQNRYPLTLILDATTDGRGRHYVITYIRSLETDKNSEGEISQYRPMLYFYKLMELGVEETADAYLDMLTTSFGEKIESEYQFSERIKNNLIAIGSDGASVMIGRHNGLVQKLGNHLGKRLLSVHCLAHRLHLATGRAWHSIDAFKTFENVVNKIYNFYNNRGHKRKAQIRATAYTLDETYYDFSQIFSIRWIASEYQAVSRVNKSFSLLLTDLQEYIPRNIEENELTSSSTLSTTVKDALYIYKKLKDKNFLAFMKFILDILNIFTHLSTTLQMQYGTLIDKKNLFQTFRTNLYNRMRQPAIEEMTLYVTSQCKESSFELDSKSCDNLEIYERSVIVKYNNILLQDNNFPKLSSIRNTLITNLIGEIDKYFDLSEFEKFEAFEPKNYPENSIDATTHRSLRSVLQLSEQFGLPQLQTGQEWERVLQTIVDSDDFELMRDATPVAFYSHFLAVKSIAWTYNTRRFVETLLILPIGSADAERGFSILKHIKYDRRSRLGTQSLNAMLRMRINGPPIERFNAHQFASAWRERGHCLTDAPNSNTMPKKLPTGENADEDEYLEEKIGKILRESNIF